MNTVRMVLADDHVVLRVGLKSFFEEQADPKIQVVGEAGSGADAIALVEKYQPDFLLLDLSMPEMGGLEATIELRRRNSQVKILILTQFTETIYLRRVLEAGVNGYILKSARGEELLSAIRAIVAGGTYIEPSMASGLVSRAFEHRKESLPGSTEEAFSRLTPREKQVLKLIAEGASNKEIANSLALSVKTVMTHRLNLMDKVGIHNRSKLIQFSIQVGLVQIPLAESQS